MAEKSQLVIVGFDGSEGALNAARWACGWCERTDRTVQLFEAVATAPDAPIQAELNRAVDAELDKAIATLHEEYPAVSLTKQMSRGNAPSLLSKLSADHPVVIGSRGLGTVTSLLLGSVSAAVASHSRGNPIIVVPPQITSFTGQRIVVGFDNSEQSQLAAKFAFLAAVELNLPVQGVIGRTLSVPAGTPALMPANFDQDAIESVRAAWIDLARNYPGVDQEFTTSTLPPAQALQKASDDALFISVGSRGNGGFAALLLGSTSRNLLNTANSVVAVIRDPEGADKD